MITVEKIDKDRVQLNQKDKIGCIYFQKLDDEYVYIEAHADVSGEFNLRELLKHFNMWR